MGNDVYIWELAQVFEKRINYVGNDLDLWKTVGNDVYIWEMAQVFEKRLNYVGNDLDLWEMAQICGEMT